MLCGGVGQEDGAEEAVASVAPSADLISAVGGPACHLLAWVWTAKTNHFNHNPKQEASFTSHLGENIPIIKKFIGMAQSTDGTGR